MFEVEEFALRGVDLDFDDSKFNGTVQGAVDGDAREPGFLPNLFWIIPFS